MTEPSDHPPIDSPPRVAGRRSRWFDRILTLLLLLLAIPVVAPVAGTMLARDQPLPPGPVLVGPQSSASPGPSASADPGQSSNPPACARGSLIGTMIAARTVARVAPSPSARAVHAFTRSTALGTPQVFLLRSQVVGADGAPWFQALLPVRPNGTTGFVRGADLRIRSTLYRLDVDRRLFTLRLFEGCALVRTYPVGIGTGATPTPVGQFYLTSLLELPYSGSVYGPYAYGLSGYSDKLVDWRGGGIIGLHGTDDPSSIGRRSSHGCIRMRNRDIRALVKLLPLGTPITIH